MFIQDLMELRIKRAQAKAAKKTAANVALGLSIGAALGVVVGVLLAPQSGKETREDIVAGAKEVVEIAKEQVDKAETTIKKKLTEDEFASSAKTAARRAKVKTETKEKLKQEDAGRVIDTKKKRVA